MFYVYWMSIAYCIALSMFHLDFLHRWKEWLIHHQKNLLLLAGFLVVGALAFESGLLRGKLDSSEPLVISIPALAEATTESEATTAAENQANQAAGMERTALKIGEKQESGQCPFVGSRNSNKYHLATCAVAKRIKQENRICFASKEDAEKRGYVPSCMK